MRCCRKRARLDVLLNNACITIRKPIEEMTIDEWNTMMDVNTGRAFLGCKYAIPIMRKIAGGAIINTSSACGLIGHRYTPEACSSGGSMINEQDRLLELRKRRLMSAQIYFRGSRRKDWA